jgi:diguanylate cyclase (GGDEF)-like protein/PAS domain S-box-containing protein
LGIFTHNPLKTILLVENDAAASEADADTLKSFGYDVIIASAVETAVEFALYGQGVDLVLMKLDLGPPLDGAQAAHEILLRRKVPLLIFSSHLEEEKVAIAREIPGCYGYVAKSSGKYVCQAAIEMALALSDANRGQPENAPRERSLVDGSATPQALNESEERLHQILSALHEAIWLRDVRTRQVLYVNQAFEQLCGISREEFYKNPNAFINLIHPDDKKWVLKGKLYRSDVHRIVRPDGSIRWVWGRTFPVKNAQGEIYRTANITEDITDRKRTEEELHLANEKLMAQMKEIQLLQSNLRDQVIRDPLTGLYNRRYLSETLDRELDRAMREGYPVSLVMIDIDDFKQVNDTYGHFAGDLVLKHLAQQLTRQTRASDLVCRMGGDEFLIVFPNLTAHIAVDRAEECRAAFEETAALFEETPIRTTISIGVATFPEHGATEQDVLSAADRAMYEAKVTGRNRVVASRI